jgi:hypothetical protein
MTIGDHLGQLTINEASNFSNVEIKADSIELTGNITTTGTINGAPPIYTVSDTLDSMSIRLGLVKQIISAPGSGKIINVISSTFIYKYNTATFGSATTLFINHSNNTSLEITGLSTLDAASSFTCGGIHNASYSGDMSNKALYFGTSSTNTTGNGTAKVIVKYTIENY